MKVLFSNKQWHVDLDGRTIWVDCLYSGNSTSGIVYHDNTVAYDQPEMIPPYIKAIIREKAAKL